MYVDPSFNVVSTVTGVTKGSSTRREFGWSNLREASCSTISE